MKSYPMIAVLAVVVAFLLLLDGVRPSVLLRETEFAAIDSVRTYTFVLRSDARDTRRCWRYETAQRVLLYLPRDSTRPQPQAGDTVLARTAIRRGGKTSGFDYGLYLRRQGIIGTAYASRYDLRPATRPVPPSLQQRLYRRLAASGLSGDQLALTGALTLGCREELDPALRRRFQASGAAHVLAVSGLHTGILYALLVGLLTLGGRIRPRYENRWGRCLLGGTVVAVLWGYTWLTGMTPSVVRCVVMLTLVETGRMLYRKSLTLNTIAAAAVLILLVRPLDLWSVSFQLSFAATVAIVIIARDFERGLHMEQWERDGLKNRLLGWLVGTLIVSLGAQIGTLPVSMYCFGQVSNYFLLTNLLVLPLATLLVPCGLACVALGGSGLGCVAGRVTSALAWLMNHAVAWIESLPGSAATVQTDGWMTVLLYAAIGMGWLTLHRSLWWLAGVAAAVTGFCMLYVL